MLNKLFYENMANFLEKKINGMTGSGFRALYIFIVIICCFSDYLRIVVDIYGFYIPCRSTSLVAFGLGRV